MSMIKIAAGIAAIFWLSTPATAAMYRIENPADTIKNPADKMYNPATTKNNPSANIQNPASGMDDPDALAPPGKPGTAPRVAKVSGTASKQSKDQPGPHTTVVPRKNHHFKNVSTYLKTAERSFALEDHLGLISISEDALRRIAAGTLKASKKTKKTFLMYQAYGYAALESSTD